MIKSYKITVKGKVQGVYYRKTIHHNVQLLHVSGYVKNLKNGDVEVGVNIEEERLNDFVEILKKGSDYSKVNRIEIRANEEQYKDFVIAY